jgi:Tfp pilus assembly protein PilP
LRVTAKFILGFTILLPFKNAWKITRSKNQKTSKLWTGKSELKISYENFSLQRVRIMGFLIILTKQCETISYTAL